MRPFSRFTVAVLSSLLSTLCTGCWAGHRLGPLEVEYAHPAVRWVYRTGGQIGNSSFLIAPIPNIVYELRPGNGYALVHEGQPGCMEIGPWQPSFALDAETGRLVTAKGGEPPVDFVTRLSGMPDGWMTGTLGKQELVLRHSSWPSDRFISLLRLRPRKDARLELSGTTYAIEPKPHLLVFPSGLRHVICVDVSKLPAS